MAPAEATAPAATPTPPPPHPKTTPKSAAPCPKPHPYISRKSNGSGMLVAGLVSGTMAYIGASVSGAAALDKARRTLDDDTASETARDNAETRRKFGRRMLVPVIGPFMAIGPAQSAMAAWGAGMAGGIQLVAAGLTIAGAVRYSRWQRQRRVALQASPSRHGGHMAVTVRF